MLERMIASDASILAKLSSLIQQNRATSIHQKSTQEDPFIIPVVFHVIHNGGTENISKAQILDQMATLNLDFMRLNADTNNTRDIFKPIAGIPNIQFRLANKDPQGNCTDGIVRIKSSRTENAEDPVKAISYWPSDKYLNIWVVKSIAVDQGQQGITLGYAQFPGLGSPNTDGVVIRSDYVGSTGTALSNNNDGRTLTHEIGHILGLFHTFQGGCTGGFFGEDISDTPPAAEANFGCSTSVNSCNNDNPDLPDMIENYMDYANGSCMNAFTQGQVTKMQGILTGTRASLVSSSNLADTGTDDEVYDVCGPKAHFLFGRTLICTGGSVTFTEQAYNGVVENRQWTFEGGTPATSTDSIVTVTYNTPGLYQVTLTVSSGLGTDTRTETSLVRVINGSNPISQTIFSEGFENPDEELPIVIDNVENYGGTWQKANSPFSGSKSMRVVNFNGANPAGAVDNLTFEPIDLSALNASTMTFRVAYAVRPGSFNSSDSNERLRVYVSTNCGQSWASRYNRSGTNLSTSANTNSSFAPTNPSQWRLETVNLNTFADETNVLIRFELTSTGGNNVYIDDINLGTTGFDEDVYLNTANVEVYPNPSSESFTIESDLIKTSDIEISLIDVTGRLVFSERKENVPSGLFQSSVQVFHLPKGMYLLKLSDRIGNIFQKIIVE